MTNETPTNERGRTDHDRTTTGRRSFLRATGVAGAAAVGLLGAASGTAAAAPPDADDWELTYEDDFDDSLDSSAWASGFGWGSETSAWEATADPENVSIEDSNLRLEITNPDDAPPYPTGAVSTEGEETIGPGSYVECRARLMDLPNTIPAFWSVPASFEWPPELDIMELPLLDSSDADEVTHHIHWGETDNDLFVGDASGDFTESFHTFGCEWRADSVTYYVDGSETGSTSDGDVMDDLNDAAPFYLLLTQTPGTGWTGSPPSGDWDEYDTTMEVDWVRVWE